MSIGFEEGQAGLQVALVPDSDHQATLFAAAVRGGPDGPAWVARFDNVAAGEYEVLFELE